MIGLNLCALQPAAVSVGLRLDAICDTVRPFRSEPTTTPDGRAQILDKPVSMSWPSPSSRSRFTLC